MIDEVVSNELKHLASEIERLHTVVELYRRDMRDNFSRAQIEIQKCNKEVNEIKLKQAEEKGKEAAGRAIRAAVIAMFSGGFAVGIYKFVEQVWR